MGDRRNRSSNGCLTCRKRKKKCDELLFPVCENCQKKGLTCNWREKTKELHEHMSNVKYFGDDELKHKDSKKYNKSFKVEDSILNKLNDSSEKLIEPLAVGKEMENNDLKEVSRTKPAKILNDQSNTPKVLITSPTNERLEIDSHKVHDSIRHNKENETDTDVSFKDLSTYDFGVGTVQEYDLANVEDVDINEYVNFNDKKSFLERIALQQDIVDD